MSGYSNYYSTIARAISGLPGKTEEVRGAVYELARVALQKRLSAFDPPISVPLLFVSVTVSLRGVPRCAGNVAHCIADPA
jgi:hypothetical protein